MSITTAIRKDYGYMPYIIFLIFGAIAGVLIVILIAAHDMFYPGGHYRQYDSGIYILFASVGALMGIISLTILGWAFHMEDEELEDGD